MGKLLTKKSGKILEDILRCLGITRQKLVEMEFPSYVSPELEKLREEVSDYNLPLRPRKWYDPRKYF